MNARHALVLATASWRAQPRRELAGTAAAACAIVAASSGGSAPVALLGMQLAGITLALGLGAVLDDAAAATTAAAPIGRAARQCVATGLALPLPVATWAVLLATCGWSGAEALALSLQTAAAATLALAAGAALPGRHGIGGVALLLAAGRLILPPWATAPMPASPHWITAQVLWLAVTAAGAIALRVAGRDPWVGSAQGRRSRARASRRAAA